MFKIRNDDVSFETDIDHFVWFCELCDLYDIGIIQAITPYGISSLRSPNFTDEQIIAMAGGKCLELDNPELVEYLQSRDDEYAVHGLYHTHSVTEDQVRDAIVELEGMQLLPTYYVAPFNETFQDQVDVCGLEVIPKVQRLEDYHKSGEPTDNIVYLHSWRYDGSYYKKEDLEECLARIVG